MRTKFLTNYGNRVEEVKEHVQEQTEHFTSTIKDLTSMEQVKRFLTFKAIMYLR